MSMSPASRPAAAASRRRRVATLAVALTASLALAAPARAQLTDMLGSVGKSLGGGMPAVDQASPSNIAGVLQYCVQNKYLGGNAQSAGSSLLGRLTGSKKASTDDGAFKAGSAGQLQTGDGQTFGLGGGIKEKVTEQVCGLVLKHAQSLL